ncbi:MAG: periplasmic heavy metal sensor [Gemmatimonadetes bacterium]|nr:periplasmic heavy metal sensor [Gemmatimonadota bacterium]
MVTRKQLAALLLLVATFAVGGAAGRMSARWGWRDRGARAERAERGAPGSRFIATLDRELRLTPTQRDSVQAILRKWDPAMRAVWDGMRSKFDSLRALVRADIAQILTDDQKAAFQRWTARTDSAARKRSREAERAH